MKKPVKVTLVFSSGFKQHIYSQLPVNPTLFIGNHRFVYCFALLSKEQVLRLVFKEWEEDLPCHINPAS